MTRKSEVSVGLLGLGHIGAGVARAAAEKREAIAERVGVPVAITRALVRDPDKQRGPLPPGLELTTSASDVLDDPDIDIIVEVLGGEEPALAYINRALHSHKHVVTASKEVMAKHGPELLRRAAEHGVGLRFEASAGGGIPIIGPLLEDLVANDITAVNAIINGTTNFMLTSMAAGGIDYEGALAQATALGYAEPDPSTDVSGTDAAYKLAVLSSLAFHSTVRDRDVYREGIEQLTPEDFTYAAQLGYAIKLLATSRRHGDSVEARVHPAFLPIEHPLAKVDGVYNAIELEGDLIGWAMFHGPGAGAVPTASAVLGDVLAVAREVASGGPVHRPPALDRGLAIQPMADLNTKYYLRLRAYDRPGVMAQVTKVLGDLQVSLASVIQKEGGALASGTAEIVITTHVARESALREAVEQLAALEVVQRVCNLVRIEDRSA